MNRLLILQVFYKAIHGSVTSLTSSSCPVSHAAGYSLTMMTIDGWHQPVVESIVFILWIRLKPFSASQQEPA